MDVDDNGADLADKDRSTKQWRLGELANGSLRVFLRSKLDDPSNMHQKAYCGL